MFAPGTAADPFGLIREGLELLAGEDRAGWPAGVLSDQVLELFSVVERARAELIRCVGQWDAVQAWADDGAVTAAGWLAERAPVTRPDASRIVRSAQLCRKYERTAKALAAGDLSVSHVETLTSAERHRASVFEAHEDVLVDLAPTLTPTEFVQVMQHWCCAADDVLARGDPGDKFEHRYFDLTRTFEGTARADGFFDVEAAAVITAALDAIAGKPDPEDAITRARTISQRRADALVDLCRESLARSTRGGHHPPNVDVVINLAAFADPDYDPLRDPVSGGFGALNGHAVGHATLERLCCDANIGRVVMNGDSEVLDLGRRARFPTAAQYRALVRRDRHCRFPGCDRPPQWTDAHHLTHWTHGGTTDLDNLVLLCRRHHVLCHEHHWQLRRQPDGEITTKPPWTNDYFDYWHTQRAPPDHAGA